MIALQINMCIWQDRLSLCWQIVKEYIYLIDVVVFQTLPSVIFTYFPFSSSWYTDWLRLFYSFLVCLICSILFLYLLCLVNFDITLLWLSPDLLLSRMASRFHLHILHLYIICDNKCTTKFSFWKSSRFLQYLIRDRGSIDVCIWFSNKEYLFFGV